MKRKILVALVAVASMVVLVACGNKEKEAGKTGKTKITYAMWGDDETEKGMSEIIKGFTEDNEDIEVKIEATPWDQYWTKLEAGAAGGSMPDVFLMHGNDAVRYMENDVLLDLTGVFEPDNFPKELIDLYSLEGVNYGVPKDISTIGLFYNKTLFDDAGIDYPDETWDADKLTEVAKQLTDVDKGIFGFGTPNNNETGYYNFIYANGGSVLNEDKTASTIAQPEAQEAIQWWADFMEDGSSPTYAQLSENTMDSYFISGRLAMGTFGSWQVDSFKENEYVLENCDVTYLPKMKERATIYNGLAASASAKTKNKEAVIKFMTYLGSEKAALIHSESGLAMAAYNGTQDKWAEATSDLFNTQVFVDMLDDKVLRPNGRNFQKAESRQTEELGKVFAGDVTVKELTEKLEPELTKILNE